jgi:DNA-binding beta-propeller fold protein YncE
MRTISNWILCFICSVLIFIIPATSVYAESPYEGYIWNSRHDAPSINGYLYKDSIDGLILSSGPFKAPEDIYINESDHIYIVDSGNNRIVLLDNRHELIKIYGDAEGPGKLNGPKGIYVKGDGTLYVADTLNGRIAIFDKDGAFKSEILSPSSPLLGANFIFSPSKLIVDKRDYLIVANDGTSSGLLQIDPNGKFKGYFGANMIEFSWTRLFVRLFATDEQRAQLATVRPQEFSNLYQDEEGFIWTSTLGAEYNQIKRLSAVGVDTYNPDWTKKYNRKDFGDTFSIGSFDIASFVDLTVDKKGVVTGLDISTGKAFQYDKVRSLLFVFGGLGDQDGLFKTPVAIDQTSDGSIYVLDKTRGRIDRFRTTPFGDLVHHASELFVDGRYAEAKEPWTRVLELDSNYDLAYGAIGKALEKEEHWKEAMAFHKKSRVQANYSTALREYRKQWLRENFGSVVAGIIIVYLLFKFGVPLLRKRLNRNSSKAAAMPKSGTKGGFAE